MQRTHYQAVVIGGGVVGASVLYHLAALGWNDVILIERKELTAGSTWHAAADFHTLNADPNISALQKYTIDLYHRLEKETGLDIGIELTGGVNVASTPERWEWLQAAYARYQTIGIDTARLITPEEIKELCPIIDLSNIYGGTFDTNEGHIDAVGLTNALATAAKNRGAEVVRHNQVVELHRTKDGGWSVVTEHGTITADNVVNAAGLWARKVGRMAGIELPVIPMEHHYLVSEAIPEVAEMVEQGRDIPTMVDLDGFSYLRREGQGVLLGLYEQNPKVWERDGAPWDFGTNLLRPDIDRIAPELELGMARWPFLEHTGIKTWVNGPFTFSPDGNPLVGPVPGVPGYWVACGVMAGFSQGGGVGLALAQWMINGEPENDVFGMDIARFGPFASADGYLEAMSTQFYARRFVMTYPNEDLPAGRPFAVSPLYDTLKQQGAHFSASWGLEMPRYFTPDDPEFVETPSLHRSNAFDVVAREVKSVRDGVGILDISSYARYEITGPGARAWLDKLLASDIPGPGRMKLAPMLSESGRLLGDLTVTCWGEDEFWLMGSYYLRSWHGRYFRDLLPSDGSVRLRDITGATCGVSIAGPKARDLLSRLTRADVSGKGLGFMRARELDLGFGRGRVVRVSLTGELGYEINLPAGELRSLYRAFTEAGDDLGLAPFGFDALVAARLEKSWGIWSREFTWAYTPGMSGLDEFVAFDKPTFIGRDAALRERETGASQKLVTIEIDPIEGGVPADAGLMDPIWSGGSRVGFVTSGGYGHTVGKTLALGYVDVAAAAPGTEIEVYVVGKKTTGRVLAPSPYDPAGERLRG